MIITLRSPFHLFIGESLFKLTTLIFSEKGTKNEAVIAVVVVVLGIFVAFFIICIIKRRKTRQEEAKRKTSDEVNNVLIL